MEGLLGGAVEAGALPVTDSQRAEVRDAARGRARVDLCLEHELLATVQVLEDAGVASRVLKGQAWAHTVYPDPSWRGVGDIDLLVRSDDWYRAIELLTQRGARRTLPELRPGFDRRFGKDAMLNLRSGWQIDLHRTLVVGPFGLWVAEEDLFARPTRLSIGGVTVTTLNPEASFVHTCYNAVLGDDPPRLIAVRDVCQVALAGTADPDVVEDMVGRWRSRAVVARALVLAADLHGREVWRLPIAKPFEGYRAALRERVLVASYRGPGRGYTSQLATIAALHGARERLAYLGALARPQRPYLDARGSSPLNYLRTAIRRIRDDR